MFRVTAAWIGAVVITGLVVFAVAVGSAQLVQLAGPERKALIYDGDLEMDSGGIQVLSWGSGSAESVHERQYVGPEVLKVTSQGPHQGIVLHLAHPLDMGEFMADPDGYLDLRVLPAQTPRPRGQLAQPGQPGAGPAGRRGARAGAGGRGGRGGREGAMGGMRGGMGGARGGMGGARGGTGEGMGRGMGEGMGGMRGGARGDMGGPGMGGERGAGGRRGMRQGTTRGAAARPGAQPGLRTPGLQPGAAAAGNAFTLKNLRLVLFTDRGMLVADPVPVGVLGTDERDWIRVSAALSRFRGAEGAGTLRAIGVFADDSDVFYLGRARLVVDKTPVRAALQAGPTISRVDQIINFSLQLRGGPIDPEVSWDFDDSDGVQEQAVGDKVKYAYKAPGDYMATCTVTDRAGVRSPIVNTVGIHVEGTE
jgi:hypothetical protein